MSFTLIYVTRPLLIDVLRFMSLYQCKVDSSERKAVILLKMSFYVYRLKKNKALSKRITYFLVCFHLYPDFDAITLLL